MEPEHNYKYIMFMNMLVCVCYRIASEHRAQYVILSLSNYK